MQADRASSYAKIIAFYTGNKRVRDIVDIVLLGQRRPCFIPCLNRHVGVGDDTSADTICYHDHQERTTLTKWVRLIAVEGFVPTWLPPILKEVFCYEVMKSYLHHSFNRLAWVVGRQVDGITMDYKATALLNFDQILKFALTGNTRMDDPPTLDIMVDYAKRMLGEFDFKFPTGSCGDVPVFCLYTLILASSGGSIHNLVDFSGPLVGIGVRAFAGLF